jgi:HSP20 family molecular chaperone IbpA
MSVRYPSNRQNGRPITTSVDAIKAEMRDGLLHITLDKVPEAQPRKIAIESR